MDYYDDLPEDTFDAFLHLEAEFRKELQEKIEHSDSNGNYTYDAADYMNKTLAAANFLEIGALTAYEIDTRNSSHFDATFTSFKRDVDKIIVQIRIMKSRRKGGMSVGLSSEQKTKIHALIGKIRDAIESSAATVPKKEKLFSILTRLAEEVDKHRTGFERFGDLARGLSGISREVAEEGAEPWWKWFKALMGVVDEAKESEPQLPKLPETKRIEPPRKQLPKPKGAEFDDEIPF